MEEKMLTREEIALSILNGILCSMSNAGECDGALYLMANNNDAAEQRDKACRTAFQIADVFIQERIKQV